MVKQKTNIVILFYVTDFFRNAYPYKKISLKSSETLLNTTVRSLATFPIPTVANVKCRKGCPLFDVPFLSSVSNSCKKVSVIFS